MLPARWTGNRRSGFSGLPRGGPGPRCHPGGPWFRAQEAQSELLAVRQQKQDIDEELDKLSVHSIALEQNCNTLGQEKAELESLNAELQDRTARLLERQSLLEQTAESLKLENGTLLQQFDRLRLTHDSETAAFHEQLASLKDRVLAALGQFASGDLSAEQLVACLSASGVTLRTPGQPGDEEDGSLTARLDSARSREERLQCVAAGTGGLGWG